MLLLSKKFKTYCILIYLLSFNHWNFKLNKGSIIIKYTTIINFKQYLQFWVHAVLLYAYINIKCACVTRTSIRKVLLAGNSRRTASPLDAATRTLSHYKHYYIQKTSFPPHIIDKYKKNENLRQHLKRNFRIVFSNLMQRKYDR